MNEMMDEEGEANGYNFNFRKLDYDIKYHFGYLYYLFGAKKRTFHLGVVNGIIIHSNSRLHFVFNFWKTN